MYITEKYWDSYIGGADDSMTLLDYLADKNSENITLKELFEEFGFNNDNYDFRNPSDSITVSLNAGMEVDFYYAIQLICDLAAILLECKKNGSVDLQELSGGMLENDEVIITLSAAEKEEKIILDILQDFVENPMEYNLSEMCPEEDMMEMAALCKELNDVVLVYEVMEKELSSYKGTFLK